MGYTRSSVQTLSNDDIVLLRVGRGIRWTVSLNTPRSDGRVVQLNTDSITVRANIHVCSIHKNKLYALLTLCFQNTQKRKRFIYLLWI